jgi:hypothetical protein
MDRSNPGFATVPNGGYAPPARGQYDRRGQCGSGRSSTRGVSAGRGGGTPSFVPGETAAMNRGGRGHGGPSGRHRGQARGGMSGRGSSGYQAPVVAGPSRRRDAQAQRAYEQVYASSCEYQILASTPALTIISRLHGPSQTARPRQAQVQPLRELRSHARS